MIGSRSAKSASLASMPLLQPVSCAVTRTLPWAIGAIGAVQENAPEFGTAVAITIGYVAPPSVE